MQSDGEATSTWESSEAFCCRLGSSDSSFDGMADISAVLKSCKSNSPADIGTGDHPLSQGLQEQSQCGVASESQYSGSSVLLSGRSSSIHVASDTDAQVHRHGIQPKETLHMAKPGESRDTEEEGRFARKLQEFQKGTDILRQ